MLPRTDELLVESDNNQNWLADSGRPEKSRDRFSGHDRFAKAANRPAESRDGFWDQNRPVESRDGLSNIDAAAVIASRLDICVDSHQVLLVLQHQF